MLCPYCDYENTPGADTCEECLQPLTEVEPASAPAADNILYNEIRLLKPAPALAVDPGCSVSEAIGTMVQRGIGCVLVCDGEELLGVFSERDVLMKISQAPVEALQQPVSDFMTPNPETVQNDDEVAFALHKMDVGGYRHLPVIEGQRVVGIISVRDVLKLLVAEVAPAS